MFGSSLSVNLIRAYVCPLPGSASIFIGRLILHLTTGGAEPVSKVSINYDAEREISSRRDLTSPIAYADLESVIALNNGGGVVLSLAKQFHSSVSTDSPPVFELTLVRPENRSFIEEINTISGLKEFFVPLYGYARTLSADWSPISEIKLKRGFFGGTSVSVPKRSETWLMSDQAVSAGAIRGVYPVNYWSELARESILRIGLKLPEADVILDGIRCFGENQQKQILKDNRQFARFIHFGRE
jgi:hypothetical protein